MAQVPYQPEPGPLQDVNIQGPRIPEVPEAFGVNLGQALQRGGQEVFARAMEIQQLNNENTARQTSIAATGEMSDVFAKFDSLEGQARADQFPKMRQDLEAIRQRYRSNLNPMAARMFDQEAASLQNSFTRYGALRAGQGIKDEAIKTVQANVDLESRPYLDPDDEGEFNTRMANIKSKLQKMMDPNVGGWSQAQYDDAVLKQTTQQKTIQIEGQALRNPQKAFETYDQAIANKQISGQEGIQLLQRLQSRNREITGNLLANGIFKAGGTLEEMEARAEEQAPQYAHGDASFTKSVINDIRGFQVIENQATQQQKRTDEQTIIDAIHAKNPQSERELLADPALKATYDRAQAHGAFKTGLQPMIQANIKDQTNQQNDDNYKAWYGMGLTPTMREEFLNRTATGLTDVQMAPEQRKDIMRLRKQLIDSPIYDKRLGQAIKALTNTHYEEMNTLGVLRPPKPDADDSIKQTYGRFLVDLQEGLDAYAQKHNGQAPGPREFEEEIAKPILRTHGEAGMFGVYTEHGPFGFDRGSWSVPQEELDKAKESMNQDAVAAGLPPEFTDRDAHREVMRQQWKKFFGGSTSQPQ